jgi:hypothetical protein
MTRRLLRRHIGTSLDALIRSNQATHEALKNLVFVWNDVYCNEFEMERRTRSGMLDRLAVVDAIQIKVELLEQDVQSLRSRD